MSRSEVPFISHQPSDRSGTKRSGCAIDHALPPRLTTQNHFNVPPNGVMNPQRQTYPSLQDIAPPPDEDADCAHKPPAEFLTDFKDAYARLSIDEQTEFRLCAECWDRITCEEDFEIWTEAQNVKIEYVYSKSLLRIFAMPSDIHQWMAQSLGDWTKDVLRTDFGGEVLKRFRIIQEKTVALSSGTRYQSDASWGWTYMSLDAPFTRRWTTLLEVAFSHEEDDLHDKIKDYFEGYEDVQRVLAIIIRETPAYRAPNGLPSQTADTFVRSKLIIDPQTSKCSYDGQTFVGEMQIMWQVWDRNPNHTAEMTSCTAINPKIAEGQTLPTVLIPQDILPGGAEVFLRHTNDVGLFLDWDDVLLETVQIRREEAMQKKVNEEGRLSQEASQAQEIGREQAESVKERDLRAERRRQKKN